MFFVLVFAAAAAAAAADAVTAATAGAGIQYASPLKNMALENISLMLRCLDDTSTLKPIQFHPVSPQRNKNPKPRAK